jgi:hypothetical protein
LNSIVRDATPIHSLLERPVPVLSEVYAFIVKPAYIRKTLALQRKTAEPEHVWQSTEPCRPPQ